MSGLLLRGGTVLDPGGERRADVDVRGGRITAVGADLRPGPDTAVVDCAGLTVVPGLVDAHSHAGAQVFREEVQLAHLRQGVTTLVVGQDGVSHAGDDGAHAGDYFAVIDGPLPSWRGGGFAELLSRYDGTVAVNVATLAGAGTLRRAVVGDGDAEAGPEQLEAMRVLLVEALAGGAVGLSTGLDYVPGMHASTAELAALCQEVALADGVHASHVRGGYEANLGAGLAELGSIARASGVRSHVSHLHAPIDLALGELDRLLRSGVEVTFDAYPYSRGCTLLAMLVLPPRLARPGSDALAEEVRHDDGKRALLAELRARVTSRPDLGAGWADQITISHVASPRWHWVQGKTLAQAAAASGDDPASLAVDVLAASRCQVSAIMAVPRPRTTEELARLFRHPAHTGGSDGISVGSHPHPRAWGTFARYLADFGARGLLPWPELVGHLSTRPAEVFRLGRRGRVAPGWVADLAVVDRAAVRSSATYEHPRELAQGVRDVVVDGVLALRDGGLTGARPGRGLRRLPRP